MSYQDQLTFRISQRYTALINRFDLETAAGERIGFAEQKRFSFKEKVTVWSDDAKSDVLLTIEADSVLDVHGKFHVRDGNGAELGYARKRFKESLLRSTWDVFDAEGKLLYRARERNLITAVLRRIGGLIPVGGELLEQLPLGFDIIADGETVGHHKRGWSLRDRYEITIDERFAKTDKRLLLSLGLLLDILQQR